MVEILNTDQVATLLTLVEEAARSSEEGVRHFVEPAPGTLRRATNKRHHVIFGRRGSGKSSLLRKAAADLTVDRRPIANVNLEAFKGHSYPDVLLSVLIATFKEFQMWMNSAAIYPAHKKSFWKTLFGTAPTRSSFEKRKVAELSSRLQSQIQALTTELHRSDGAALRLSRHTAGTTEYDLGGNVEVTIPDAGVDVGMGTTFKGSSQTSHESEEQFKRSKTDFLHRHIFDYQTLFSDLADVSGGDAKSPEYPRGVGVRPSPVVTSRRARPRVAVGPRSRFFPGYSALTTPCFYLPRQGPAAVAAGAALVITDI